MKILAKYIFALALLFLCHGCFSQEGNSSNFIERDAFVHVEVNSTNMLTETGETRERQGSGSGVIVKSDVNRMLIITAAHVCSPNPDFLEGSTFNYITVSTWNRERFLGDIIGIDMVNDLCMLETDFSGLPYIKVSRILPKPGDAVYNLAAPYGIFGNKFILTFTGTYAGTIHLDNEQVYTIPAGPGSSGSPVLNANGHLIGIIHSSTTVMETISIGPTTESIIEFVAEF